MAERQSSGTYPFGSRSRSTAVIPPGPRHAFVLGAYPSALHIVWTPPAGLGRRVRALAVADEPWPFWDGADHEARVQVWIRRRWQDSWGSAESTFAFNGSSGRALVRDVLEPLHLDPERTWSTDCLDRYHLSVGMAKAINEVYEGSSASLALPKVDLPTHPSSKTIVANAQRERLARELEITKPKIVVSLGEAAFEVLRSLLTDPVPDRLRHDAGYGSPVEARLGRRNVVWYPLIHPGQRTAPWRPAHAAWMKVRD